MNHQTYKLHFLIAVLCGIVAGYFIGRDQGIQEAHQFYRDHATATARIAAEYDGFEDCEGYNIRSVRECYGDE